LLLIYPRNSEGYISLHIGYGANGTLKCNI